MVVLRESRHEQGMHKEQTQARHFWAQEDETRDQLLGRAFDGRCSLLFAKCTRVGQ